MEASDAIIVLPGGTGTLDEYTEIVETKKWGSHNKPIILLNIDGFWEGLLQQYRRMQSGGFLGKKIEDLVYFAGSPVQAVHYMVEQFEKCDEQVKK